MKVSIISVLATTVLSTASAQCLLQSDANTLATNFGKLVSNYSEALANKTLAPDFIDYSESVNTLIDNGGDTPVPLLSQTFSSRAAFEKASAAQPSVPFAVKNVWFNCNTITVRWESDQSPKPVIGISVMQTRFVLNLQNPVLFQIAEVWGEFDSGAWLTNLGILKQASKKQRREIAFEA
ncbi:hypothetical protein LTR78_004860 [Recurvomyces mirabilis]|uniref:NTF2-like domain-containing protein n=1 Tax=Recurvomyces mirabilis TaxID=574656 RepID=A0AAE1C289_9PEZI|nr:hypothetical protein LTR78_004860 [Recurvomyces mirabilis]KAK5158031.1 hypothetical protein LTS14_003954 [Recurvomyces mirabilis]